MIKSVSLEGEYFYKSDVYEFKKNNNNDSSDSTVNKKLFCVAFSLNGKILATGDESGNVGLWKLKQNGYFDEWEVIKIIKEHTNGINCFAFSNNNEYLLSGSHDRLIILYDLNTFSKIISFHGHTSLVMGLEWINEKIFTSCGWDNTLKVWNIESNNEKEINSISTKASCYCMAKNKSNTHIATGHQYPDIIKIWEVSSFFSPSFTTTTTTVTDNKIKMLKELPKKHKHVIRSLDYSIKNILASASYDNDIILWDASTIEYKFLTILKGHTYYVTTISFSPDGLFLVSSSCDKTIKYWDCSTFECVNTNDIHSGYVYYVAFSPLGDCIASGGGDRTMVITSLIDKKKVIEEQSNLMLSMYKSKIRTPYIIIDYFGDFMMDVRYRQINNNNNNNDNNNNNNDNNDNKLEIKNNDKDKGKDDDDDSSSSNEDLDTNKNDGDSICLVQ
jgi:WD40 repeat protein